jgi:hypothetical protein
MQYFLSFIVNHYEGLQTACKPEYLQQNERSHFHHSCFYFLLEANSIKHEESFTISDHNL